jgi:hypothetical protein
MSLNHTIVLNAILDLGIVAGLAAVMAFPFTLDRRRDEASIYSFTAPLPEELAA